MAESVREVALAKVAKKLAGMTGTRPWGGPYRNNPRVSREFRHITQAPEFPYLIVLEGPNTTIPVEEQRSKGATLTVYTHRMSVLVFGYVSGDREITRSTWLQRLWDDVARTLLKANTLDSTVRSVDFGEEFEVDEGELEPKGAFLQEYIVEIDDEMEVV